MHFDEPGWGRTIFVDELKVLTGLMILIFDITVNSAYISLIVGGIVSELLSAIVVAVSVVNANERIAGKRRADMAPAVRSMPTSNYCPYGKVHVLANVSPRGTIIAE